MNISKVFIAVIISFAMLISPRAFCKADETDNPALEKYKDTYREEYKVPLKEIDEAEAQLKSRPDDEALKKELSLKHLALANRLMLKEFYLNVVEPHLLRSIELDPENVQGLMSLASAYYVGMRYDKAIEYYKKLIKVTPGALPAYKMAGDASVAIGDFDNAKKFYQGLIDENSKAVLAYDPSEIEKVKSVMNALPQTYRDIDEMVKSERFDEAEEVLRKRLSMNEADYIAMTELGYIFQHKGDRKGALRLFETAVKIAPDYPVAHLFLGRLYFLNREYEDAIEQFGIFKNKMKLLPKMDKDTKAMYVDSLKYLSEVYYTLERYEEALKEIREILKLEPKDQEAYYSLAMYYYKYEHNKYKTYEALKKVIELGPDTEMAKDANYAIEYMRANPDSRVMPDFSFIDKQE